MNWHGWYWLLHKRRGPIGRPYTTCCYCKKVAMYTVNIGGKDVCEECTELAWKDYEHQQEAEDYREDQERSRAASRGVL